MKYQVCNLLINVNIDQSKIILLDSYNEFRIFDSSPKADITINAIFCNNSELNHSNGKVVFQIPYNMDVLEDESCEYRRFYDFYSHEIIAELICPKTGHKTLYLSEKTPINEMALLNYLAIENDLYKRGIWILHSSCVSTSHGAIIFTAPSETGKSTQAELWKTYRQAEIINGDRTAVYNNNGTWFAGGLPWFGSSGIIENKQVPICAIVSLSQALRNNCHPLPLLKNWRILMEQTTVNPWNNSMRKQAEEHWLDYLNALPMFHLACLPNEDAVNTLEQYLGEKYESST